MNQHYIELFSFQKTRYIWNLEPQLSVNLLLGKKLVLVAIQQRNIPGYSFPKIRIKVSMNALIAKIKYFSIQ
jgi:hypothetical protein